MRRFRYAAVISVAILAACSNSDFLAPVPAASKVTSSVLLGFNADQPVRISEFHYDNTGPTEVSVTFEISAPGGTNLQGYTIVLYRGSDGMSYGTRFLGSVVNASCNGRGVVLHQMPNNTLLTDMAGFALVRPNGTVVEFLSYEGSFTAVNGPAAGMTSADIGVSEPGNGPSAPVTSLQRNGASPFWVGPIQNTFGSCNDQTEPPPAASVEVTPSSATFLVGATQQLTGVAYNASHQPIVNATITWVTSDPSVATVTPTGLATGVGAGDVLIIASSSGKADTANVHVDLESVEVTPSSATFVVGATQQFTAVAYGASHHPVANAIITWSSSDPSIVAVSQSGLAAGVGVGDALIIASSSGKADTANVHVDLPLAATVEVTPSSATFIIGATQQFIAVAYDASHQPILGAPITWSSSHPSIATVSVSGLATGVSAGDLLIIASSNGKADTANVHVDLPPAVSVEVTPTSASFFIGATQQFTAVAYDASHQPIVGTVISWASSNTAVATVNALGLVTGVAAGNVTITATAPSGAFATATVEVKVDNSPPTAVLNGPWSGLEGSSVSMSGAASSDPNEGDVLQYSWTFGDGHTGTGVNVSHVYPQDGVYNVQLTVTDSKGLVSTATSTASISNVAPAINAFAGATLLPGEAYSANGSFSDPGADTWTATVDYGNGSGVLALPLSGKTFSLNRVYANAGVFTVTVRVSDDDATSIRTRTVTVLSQGQGVDKLLACLQQLVSDGKISSSNANPIREALENARAKLADGRNDLAAQQLESAVKHIDAAVAVGKISAADALPLRNEILRLLQSVAPDYVLSSTTTKKKG